MFLLQTLFINFRVSLYFYEIFRYKYYNVKITDYVIFIILGIEPRDAILVAIREDYVDGVESLLQYEEDVHKEGDLYTWEKVDQVSDQ